MENRKNVVYCSYHPNTIKTAPCRQPWMLSMIHRKICGVQEKSRKEMEEIWLLNTYL